MPNVMGRAISLPEAMIVSARSFAVNGLPSARERSERLRIFASVITTDPSMNTIVMGLKQMFPSGDDIADWPVIMATSILAMIPPVIVVISMQKLFIRGLVDSEK